MSKGGLIIRLIDVVLILLLGFIGISDFTIKTQLKLPQGTNETAQPVSKTHVVFLRITKNAAYEIEDGKTNIREFEAIDEVENYLLQLQEQYGNLVAVIEPHIDTIIQLTVDIIDVCEKNNIQKSINYEI